MLTIENGWETSRDPSVKVIVGCWCWCCCCMVFLKNGICGGGTEEEFPYQLTVEGHVFRLTIEKMDGKLNRDHSVYFNSQVACSPWYLIVE